MKKIFTLLLALTLVACMPGDKGANLNSPEGLKVTQELLQKNFAKYNNITEVSFGTNRGVIDIITVRFNKGEKDFYANYVTYNDQVNESETGLSSKQGRTISLSEVNLSIVPNLIKKAESLILEKDNKFNTFRMDKLNYEVQEDGTVEVSFVIDAIHPATSYYGERKGDKGHLSFEFKADANGENVRATKGLTI